MTQESQYRKKLSEREIAAMSETEVKRIERINDSNTRSENAEANKESQRKLRVLFERAPEETLPFLVYCIYVGATGLTGFIYLISNFKDNMLLFLLAILLIFLILPMFVLPKLHVKKFFLWIFRVKKLKNEKKIL